MSDNQSLAVLIGGGLLIIALLILALLCAYWYGRDRRELELAEEDKKRLAKLHAARVEPRQQSNERPHYERN